MSNLNNIRRFLAFIAILSAVIIIAVISYRVQRVQQAVGAIPGLQGNVEVSLNKIHYTESKNGLKKWDLVAEKAEYDKVKEITSLNSVRMVVAGGSKTGDLTLEADRALFDNRSKNVVLAGNVRGRSKEGLEIVTESVTYVSVDSILKSSDRVWMSDGNITVKGTGLEFHTDSKVFRLLKDVDATVGGRKVK
jgi:LPS export ABC transporter protein LptC